jgi:chemotaxis family two-component system sensor kinase Cph1
MQRTNYDSDFCGSLPIHLTNLIQPYGVLLVIEPVTYQIVQASENTEAVFSKQVQNVVQTYLEDHVNAPALESLKQKLGQDTQAKVPAVWEIGGKQFLVLVHRKEQYMLAEIDVRPLDPARQRSFVDVYQELKFVMSAIESAATIEEGCVFAARALKRISGFDKVMIYAFDAEWNGHVVAESAEPDMESYIGFTFPASDIPRQARQLYLKNPYRLIPDRESRPVKLYPVVNPIAHAFIDLSDCNLRSVTAVHLEYLKNMGVMASMSTRILYQDNLWGLIACHHKTPQYLSYEMCSVFEMLSGVISAKITSLQRQEAHAIKNSITSTYTHLVESIYKTGHLDSALLAEFGVLKLFEATGAVVSRNGGFYTTGETPRREALEELLLWLHTRQLKRVFQTDSLSREYEHAREYSDIASGMLVIPINSARDQYLIVFRPERVHVINWGGNPADRIQFEKDEKNYHPRSSFKQWQEKVSGISPPWKSEELEIAESLRSFIYEYETYPVAG